MVASRLYIHGIEENSFQMSKGNHLSKSKCKISQLNSGTLTGQDESCLEHVSLYVKHDL
jgi:hypothetical protein